jgi:hypothetical protein
VSIDIPALDQQMRDMTRGAVTSRVTEIWDRAIYNVLCARTCLSCGAKTDHNGEIPCGH